MRFLLVGLIAGAAADSLRGFLQGGKISTYVPVHGAPVVPYHGPATTADSAGHDSGLDDTGLLDPGALTSYHFQTGTRDKQVDRKEDKLIVV